MKLTLQVELCDYSFSEEKWIEYKVLPGSNGWGHAESCHRNLKALPFFISLRELLPVVIKNPVFVPLSLHFGSLTFIWFLSLCEAAEYYLSLIFPVKKGRCVTLNDLPRSSRKSMIESWKKESIVFLHSAPQSPEEIPAMSRIVWCSALLPCQDQKPWLSLYRYIFDLLPALFDRQSIFFL